jgi:hypothetical protein
MQIKFRGKIYTRGKRLSQKTPYYEGYFFNCTRDMRGTNWYFVYIQKDMGTLPGYWKEFYIPSENTGLMVFDDFLETNNSFFSSGETETHTSHYYEAVSLSNTLKKL